MPWITPDDLKTQLNKDDFDDDAELVGFIDSACSMIERLKGHVDLVTITDETHRARHCNTGRTWRDWAYPGGQRYLIDLYQTPVASITSVGRYDGTTLTSIVAEDPATATLGWRLVDNCLYVTQMGEYAVAYKAGRDPVDGDYRMAALELAAHLWIGSQNNRTTGGAQVYPSDQMLSQPHIVSAMPFRVRELLGIFGNVVNDHVVIA